MTEQGTELSALTLQHPGLEGQLFAAVDLGSNSFHMLVARYDHGSLQVIDRIKEMVRLGGGIGSNGELDSIVANRALDCLSRFGQRLQEIPTANIMAVGTNAMRRIENSLSFLDQAEARLRQPIQIISGEEEARLIYHGVAHGISERGNQRLVIDIGGGSTEFIIGREFSPLLLESLFFGCVGITQRFFADGKVTNKRWSNATTAVAQELQRIATEYKSLGWHDALGSSGTMKSVRNVCLAAGYSERGITPEAIIQLRDALIDFGHCDDFDLSALSERRRPVFAGGAAVIDACIQELGLSRIIVTDYALREGLLYRLLGQILHDDPREGTTTGLITKYHIDRAQADRVRQLALTMYDQVSGDWKLPDPARDWLGRSAQLHELGLTIGHHGYHRHGAYLMASSDLPGFSRLEQQLISTIIGNHRRNPNSTHFERVLPRLQPALRRLTGLLRIAVLLCRTRVESPPSVALHTEQRRWRLSFPSNWLDNHPLTQADLVDEQTMLLSLGIDLEIVK